MIAFAQKVQSAFQGLKRKTYRPSPKPLRASADYQIIDMEQARQMNHDGWLAADVAKQQDAAYGHLLKQMFAGQPRLDFQVAADAVKYTQLDNPTLLEVGCGSGYYGQVLNHLLSMNIQYTGLDSSPAMIRLAKQKQPGFTFVQGSATELPFPPNAFDIVMNGVCLMHIIDYQHAIAQAATVARHWCIFHIVPIIKDRKTTLIAKKAYGQPTVEIVFNEQELLQLFKDNNLQVTQTLPGIAYNLQHILGQPTLTRTYICQVVA